MPPHSCSYPRPLSQNVEVTRRVTLQRHQTHAIVHGIISLMMSMPPNEMNWRVGEMWRGEKGIRLPYGLSIDVWIVMRRMRGICLPYRKNELFCANSWNSTIVKNLSWINRDHEMRWIIKVEWLRLVLGPSHQKLPHHPIANRRRFAAPREQSNENKWNH